MLTLGTAAGFMLGMDAEVSRDGAFSPSQEASMACRGSVWLWTRQLVWTEGGRGLEAGEREWTGHTGNALTLKSPAEQEPRRRGEEEESGDVGPARSSEEAATSEEEAATPPRRWQAMRGATPPR